MERACIGLEWLLDDNRWKTVGKGYENINDFLSTINLSQFKIAVDQRKKLAKRLEDMQATQRAAAAALGVSHVTIHNDLNDVKKLTKEENKSLQDKDEEKNLVKDLTPSILTASPQDVIKPIENRARIADSKKEKTETPVLPETKYNIIYADPPWKYPHDWAHFGQDVDKHYPTMTIEELCKLPIKDIAADDCVLYLWATSPLLDKIFSVITAWGFEYKTSMIWDKVKHNMGFYASIRHEILLIGGRGKSKPDDASAANQTDSVYVEERTEHSKKPDYFYTMIEKLHPLKTKRIELFSRNLKEGWEGWGNEYV